MTASSIGSGQRVRAVAGGEHRPRGGVHGGFSTHADGRAVPLFCGVCHSDLHAIHGLTGKPTAGMVPGHEFTGAVTAVGSAVTKFAPGDRVAAGTIVDSCGACPMCHAGQENLCYEGATSTYGSTDRVDGTTTKGAYSRESCCATGSPTACPTGSTRPLPPR